MAKKQSQFEKELEELKSFPRGPSWMQKPLPVQEKRYLGRTRKKESIRDIKDLNKQNPWKPGTTESKKNSSENRIQAFFEHTKEYLHIDKDMAIKLKQGLINAGRLAIGLGLAAYLSIAPVPELKPSMQQTVVSTLHKAKHLENILIDSSVQLRTMAPYGNNYYKITAEYETLVKRHQNDAYPTEGKHLISIVFDSSLNVVYSAMCIHPDGNDFQYDLTAIVNRWYSGSKLIKNDAIDGIYVTNNPAETRITLKVPDLKINATYEKTGKKLYELSTLVCWTTFSDGSTMYVNDPRYYTRTSTEPLPIILYDKIYFVDSSANFIEWGLVNTATITGAITTTTPVTVSSISRTTTPNTTE